MHRGNNELRLTSDGRAKVQDCWKGQDPELRTWILKSTGRHRETQFELYDVTEISI